METKPRPMSLDGLSGRPLRLVLQENLLLALLAYETAFPASSSQLELDLHPCSEESSGSDATSTSENSSDTNTSPWELKTDQDTRCSQVFVPRWTCDDN